VLRVMSHRKRKGILRIETVVTMDYFSEASGIFDSYRGIACMLGALIYFSDFVQAFNPNLICKKISFLLHEDKLVTSSRMCRTASCGCS